MSNIVTLEDFTEQSTTNTSFIDSNNGVMTFTPESTDDIWMIFASGIMRSTSTKEETCEVRLTVNSTVKDYAGHQNNKATTPNGAGWVMMDRIAGTTSEQTVKVQYRAVEGSTYVSNIRLVRAKVPPNADFQFAENLAETEGTGSNVSMLNLNWTPSSTGNYIVIGKHCIREYPSSGEAMSWFGCNGVDLHPDAPAGTRWRNARDNWMPVFCAWRHSFSSNQDITAYLRSANNGADPCQYGYNKIMAFREDAFDAGYYSFSATQTTTTSTTYLEKNSLVVPAPATSQEFLTIQSARMSKDAASPLDRISAELRRNGTALVRTDHKIDRDGGPDGYHSLIGVVNGRSETGSITYSNGLLSPDEITVEMAESTIIVLKYGTGAGVSSNNSVFFGTNA